ncbi:MAG: hypothetical protein HYY06_17810 [Deltaproteobacteria bacterium]|nr:hypothetical protein [Deltaproteobacteria bacterium]
MSGCPSCADAEPAPVRSRTASGTAHRAVARLERTSGDVRWRAASVASWSPAAAGLGLEPDDAVQTMQSATADLRLQRSGDLVRLAENTMVRMPVQARRAARLRHMSGLLVARVEGTETDGLEVEVPPGTLTLEPALDPDGGIEPRAEARVHVDVQRTEISMLSGAGRLDRRTGSPVHIAPRRFIEVAGDGRIVASGLAGQRVELLRPEPGRTIRTRGAVGFEWTPLAGVEGYRLVLAPEAGPRREIDVDGGAASHVLVEVPTGSYTWSVCGTIHGERLPDGALRRLDVDLDQSAPRLELGSPAEAAIAHLGAVRVLGHTEPGAIVEVGGRDVQVASDGSFSTTVVVQRGLTNIVVRASDDLGNSRMVSRTVLRE